MKYIRTKDGIYEIDETTILTSLPSCYKVIKPTDKHYSINIQQVIKSADTIEELCDEFVILGQHCRITGYGIMTIYNNYVSAIVKKFGKAKQSYNRNKGFALYGAIWTNKGLIYVAKMNDKGELELL